MSNKRPRIGIGGLRNATQVGYANIEEYQTRFETDFDIKEYINDEGSSINVLSWGWNDSDIYVRIVNIDTGQRALETTQRTASNVSSDLHRMLNYERGVVPVVDTELVESWLKNLDRDHDIRVFKKRKMEDDADGITVEGEDLTSVFPRDGMTLYSALSHLTPLETNESVIQARIESRVHQNQAVGDGVRLDALSHAVKSSLLSRPYSVYNSKMSFGADEANRARDRLIKLIERCFFQNKHGKCYASDMWIETLRNKGISDVISMSQTCPAAFNRPLIAEVNGSDMTPFVLVRSDDEDDLECPDHIKFPSKSCVIGKYASLWYDALFFSTKLMNELVRNPDKTFLNTSITRNRTEYISTYTLELVEQRCISFNSAGDRPYIDGNKLTTYIVEKEMKLPDVDLYIPQNLSAEKNGKTFNTIQDFLDDDSYWTLDEYDHVPKWVLTDAERNKFDTFFKTIGDGLISSSPGPKSARLIIEFARADLNRERSEVRNKYNDEISKLRFLKTCVERGDDKALGVISFKTTKNAIEKKLNADGGIQSMITELHYGTDRMHTSVAAIWEGSSLYKTVKTIIERRTVFSLTGHKITKYIKDTLLMPVKITVTGPKSNHCSTQCHLQGYFEETSEYNLAMSAARMEFATIKGGAENAELFLHAVRSTDEKDSRVQLAATLLKACHRANTRLTGRSATGATKVERQSLEELKHHAMCSFVLNFGHKQ